MPNRTLSSKFFSNNKYLKSDLIHHRNLLNQLKLKGRKLDVSHVLDKSNHSTNRLVDRVLLNSRILYSKAYSTVASSSSTYSSSTSMSSSEARVQDSDVDQTSDASTNGVDPHKIGKMFATNKTFMDIKNEFILFLRNRLASSSTTETTATTTVEMTTVIASSRTTRGVKVDRGHGVVRPAFFDNLADNESILYYKYHRNASHDEIVNIWKLAFFLLTFIIGLVSLLVVLTITIKIIIAKCQKGKQFKLNLPKCEQLTALEHKHHKYHHHQLQNQQHVASISLFEYNAHGFSASKFNLIPRAHHHHPQLHQLHRQQRTRTMSLSSITTNTTINARHLPIAHHNPPPALVASDHLLRFRTLDDRFVKSASMIDSIFDPHAATAAVDDDDNMSHLRDVLDQYVATTTMTTTTTNRLDSFKHHGVPSKVQTPQRRPTRDNSDTIHNEYEGMETESVGNLSSATTYSEVFEENRGANRNESSSYGGGDALDDVDLMCNRPTPPTTAVADKSQSRKVSKELEMKLKERRDLMETGGFQPRVIQELELEALHPFRVQQQQPQHHQRQRLPSPDKTTTAAAGVVNELSISKAMFFAKPAASLVKYEIVNKEGQVVAAAAAMSGVEPESKRTAEVASGCGGGAAAQKSPRIVIDTSYKLPAKRESIKMLIDNKLVSENKQKTDLEGQLNALLKYKKSGS